MTLNITHAAIQRIKEICKQKSVEDHIILEISGGGCSGFQYQFKIEEQIPNIDFITNEADPLKVFMDEITKSFITEGCEIDYVNELLGQYFILKNPNATATCGCGTSFSI